MKPLHGLIMCEASIDKIGLQPILKLLMEAMRLTNWNIKWILPWSHGAKSSLVAVSIDIDNEANSHGWFIYMALSRTNHWTACTHVNWYFCLFINLKIEITIGQLSTKIINNTKIYETNSIMQGDGKPHDASGTRGQRTEQQAVELVSESPQSQVRGEDNRRFPERWKYCRI